MSDEDWIASASFFQRPSASSVRGDSWKPATRFSRNAPGPAWGGPTLGQHTDEVLGELGYRARLDDLRAAGVIG